ncbi:MAG: hypothetical protein ACRETN_09585 [Nevskiales bacterium]
MTVIITLLAAAAIGWLVFSAAGNRSKSTTGDSELLRLCHGDKALMERLVSLEIKRAPEVSRSEAVSRAFSALKRDHR